MLQYMLVRSYVSSEHHLCWQYSGQLTLSRMQNTFPHFLSLFHISDCALYIQNLRGELFFSFFPNGFRICCYEYLILTRCNSAQEFPDVNHISGVCSAGAVIRNGWVSTESDLGTQQSRLWSRFCIWHKIIYCVTSSNSNFETLFRNWLATERLFHTFQRDVGCCQLL
jgi:hypothetical protein